MVTSFMNYLDISATHITRMILFDNIKTGNILIDTFLITMILSLFTFFINWIYENEIDRFFYNLSYDDIKSFLYKKNTIVIEGKRSSVISSYSYSCNISSAYSDRFKAIWNYIITNIDNNNTIYMVKENHTNYQSSLNIENRKKNLDMFMVFQNKHFLLDKYIYAKTIIQYETDKDDKDKLSVKTDNIVINIYSYKLSLFELIQYIDNITEKYLLSIKNNRFNKKFIYSLDKVDLKEDENRLDCWREDIFESARTFNNIFFDGKKELLDKINFFLNNKNWYYEKGIPYSLGIGLHGPPGTGKTSFIKALSNYTNRHIIILSLKLIKTKNQLEKIFFENTYNDNNEINSISWDKKIIVFEDIDCIGDIILNRDDKNKSEKKININNDSVKVADIIEGICKITETTSDISLLKDNKITLDDILNLWDGIRETPGRILIISSNHYDKLDPALVRPGRIDITHELNNASHNTISDIYLHLFGNKIDPDKLTKINEYYYSPAEIINIYVSNKNENDFAERLMKNSKV